ncbi:MAG: hypothetical protein EYC70_06335 [Planctomycetota bacterium]|nr:MAG: hypothetical protein EYC70_06335 [Planctomycetota bacterium]
MDRLPRLHELSLALRLGLTALLLTLAGGYAASVRYVFDHHSRKDEQAGLSMTDLMGAYHGVRAEAPLIRAVTGAHGEQYLPVAAERETLRKWLAGAKLSEEYDSLELGDNSPAEILDRNCLSCHARNATEGDGIGERLPLDSWDSVSKVAFSKQLDPVPVGILTVSTHAHAQTIPLVTLVVCGLFVLTRWPRGLRSGIFLLGGASVLLDVAGWWLARSSAAAVWLIVLAGGAYALAFAVAALGSLLELWLPPRKPQ